jgi:hypothetical protein
MHPFRDASAEVSVQVAQLHAVRQTELALTPTGLRSLFVRRSARLGAGITGAVAGAGIAAAMAFQTGGYTGMLIAACLVSAVVYVAVAVVASAELRTTLDRAITPIGEPFHDLAVLTAGNPLRIEHDLASRRGHASHAWPLIAAALLGPHALHLVVGQLMGPFSLDDFDSWMLGGAVYHVHVFAYAVIAAWRFPRVRHGGYDVLIAVALSAFPGFYMAFISSIFVAATAAVLALVALWPMGRIIDREQRMLAAAAAELDQPMA